MFSKHYAAPNGAIAKVHQVRAVSAARGDPGILVHVASYADEDGMLNGADAVWNTTLLAPHQAVKRPFWGSLEAWAMTQKPFVGAKAAGIK